jgi:Ubiquitin family/Zinc finger, C3HC4 type (RING finger)
MQIFIMTMLGTSIPLDVAPLETIGSVYRMIQCKYEEDSPQDQLRLCFDGESLDKSLTLMHYNIKSEDTLILHLEQTGMISTFTSNDTSDPLVRFLMLTDDERKVAAIPHDELRARAEKEKVDPFSTFVFNPVCRILCDEQCRHLCSFLDSVWTSTALDATSDRVDMRLVIDDDTFVQLLSCLDPVVSSMHQSGTLAQNLHNEYLKVSGNRGSGNASKLALRMTCGPTNACIDFHCDGGYATSTSQIALNCPSDYKGGRLCFFVSDALHVLERPVGSITQHPAKVLHGVTALTEGTRKSLFIVDFSNGLGEGGVIEVCSDHVQLFLAQQVSRSNANDKNTMPTCVVCCERAADHVVVPCGHLCLCSVCESGVITSCPICRSNFQRKQRVYVAAKRQRRGSS